MRKTIGMIGGDQRQAKLARLLAADGYEIRTYGLACRSGGTLEQAVDSDVILLPLPLCKGEGVLNCPENPIPTLQLFRRLCPEQRILAGQVRPEQQREAELCGLQLEDYFLREEVMVANAAVTAEAAIQVAMEHLEQTLLGMNCLVIGFGRIGKLLSHRLHGLGARVTVTARTPKDLAWIRACGWNALRTDGLSGKLESFGAVFNTVPASVLEEPLLQQLPQGCPCIDLASRPGIDSAAAEQLGISCVWARSLPGRLKPETAAEILRDAIHNILLEG